MCETIFWIYRISEILIWGQLAQRNAAMRTRTQFKTYSVSLVSGVQSIYVRPFFTSTESEESKSSWIFVAELVIAEATAGSSSFLFYFIYWEWLSDGSIALNTFVPACRVVNYSQYIEIYCSGPQMNGWYIVAQPPHWLIALTCLCLLIKVCLPRSSSWWLYFCDLVAGYIG